MIHDIVSKNIFRKLMIKNCEGIIQFLFDENIEFSILASLENISFNPELPKYIMDDFKPIALFTLSGYTYQSAKIQDQILTFEAGFGRENFGTFVSVPLYSILQIIIENTPIFINLSTPPDKDEKNEKTNTKNGIKKSMDIFLSNPNNKKLIKNKK